MSRQRGSQSKRQTIREKRRQEQRRQRIIMILVVAGVALVLAALLIAPSIRNALTPTGDIVQITPQNRPMVKGTAMGDPNAPVKIDVWEDFQCPACRAYTETVEPRVVENYVATGKVYYVFHNFPFIDRNSTLKESHQAANAAMCAADQGKFWDYHDMLFANWSGENQGSFSNKRLVAFAEALNLDMTQFNKCFNNNTHKAEIEADYAAGQTAGVQGTPSVFVDGNLLTPGQIPSYEDVAKAVEANLAGK